ncbi:hypothetical protein D3C77_596910 [compost metagenome]
MERVAVRSTPWQVLHGVYGFALTADLEMQLYAVGARRTHLGNALPSFDLLTLPNQQPAVVAVGAHIGIVVLDDHKFAVTP